MSNEVVEPIDSPESLGSPKLAKMGRALAEKYTRFKHDRREAEKQWLRNLRQFEGEYDPGVVIPEGKSRAYPKLTRQKCLGMVSRLMGMLFPEGEENWGVQASQRPTVDQETLEWIIGEWVAEDPQAEVTLENVEREVKKFADKAAENMSKKLADQLSDTAEHGQVDYPTLARKVIESAVKYGMGVLKGPMTVETVGVRYTMDETGRIVVTDDTQYRPYFSFVRLFDYFPDMHSKTFDQMDGEFERHILSKSQMRKLARRDDFMGDKIREYLKANPEGSYEPNNADIDLHNTEHAHVPGEKIQKGKYEVVEYWGPVDSDELAKIDESVDTEEGEIRGTVWMVGTTVIKAAVDPFPPGADMYHRFVFEEDDVNLAGKGLPQVMRDSQMGVANSTRMMLDNAHSVCGPMAEVDLNMLMQGHKPIKFEAYEIIYKDAEGAPSNARAVQNLSFDSHLNELLPVVNHFQSTADSETFVTSTPGGDISGEALRTQGNMSMVMGNSSLPFRDIVRNYDNFTVSVIHALIQWNRLFDPETHLDGDLRPIARGSTTLMAKEVRAYALDNLATTLNEEEREHIDMRQLAQARLTVRDLPESLMLSTEEVERRRQEREEQMAVQQQLAEALQQANLATVQAQAQERRAKAAKTRAEAGLPPEADTGEPVEQDPGQQGGDPEAEAMAQMMGAMGGGNAAA